MEEHSVIISEIADECLEISDKIDANLLFSYGKKQWHLKTCLTENANGLVRIISNCKYFTAILVNFCIMLTLK